MVRIKQVCTYTCKGLCQLDRQCKWANGGCKVKVKFGNGRRRLTRLENIERSVNARKTQGCLTEGSPNPACAQGCETGCCLCNVCIDVPIPSICAPSIECDPDSGTNILDQATCVQEEFDGVCE